VRLADLNAPELGDEGADDATDCLDSLVYGKNVYLNADDKYKTDSFGRLVCVAYADYNSTHYLNVNRTLIDGGYAKARNYDNDSISTHLRLTFLKLSPTSQREMILLSASLARLWC
jgi:endonuclease YncB( thermonuclease family)